MPNNAPHNALRYHVPGAVARGESEAIFLVSGDDRGFVYVQEFDTEEELERAYDALDERYNVWSAPYAIVDISEYVQDRYETREEAEQALASFGAGYTIVGEEV